MGLEKYFFASECSVQQDKYGANFRRFEDGENKQYAVKRVVIDEDEDWLLREPEILMQLRHPNIVTCFESWIQPVNMLEICKGRLNVQYFNKRRLHILLERCSDSLRSENEKYFQLPLFNEHAWMLTWLHDSLQALAYLQCKNILHRDISPVGLLQKKREEKARQENIVFASDRTLKFIDFGSALRLQNDEVSLTPGHGKRLYQSEEALCGKYSASDDVFRFFVLR